MIIDFKAINHDIYGKVEQPVLTLKTPDGRVITTISNYYGLSTAFRFNDISEVNFSVPAFHDGKKNECYDDVVGSFLVEVEPFGDFIIYNPEIKNEGGNKEVKTCKAYSLEYAFNYKRAEIPSGTYNFYNPIDNEDTIIQMIVELMPDWSIGTIDRELIGRWRTFDNVDDGLYSFMMNTLQESYNCLFLFDTFNKKINVMEANRSAYKLPIYLSYNNLLKSVDITELSDEIVTALSGYGSGDDVNIRSVNPNGTNTIYNLDYFLSRGALPTELADKWTRYKDSLELYQKVFSNLNTLYLQKINEKNLAKAKLAVLETDRDSLKTTYLTAQTVHGQDKNYDEEITKLRDNLESKEAEIKEQNNYIKMLEDDAKKVDEQIQDIVSICKLTAYFTNDEIKTLSPYFKQDSIADDTFVIPEYSSAVLQSNSNAIESKNLGNVKIVGAEVYASNIAEIFETNEFGKYVPYTINSDTGEKTYNAANEDIFHDAQLPDKIAETVADQLNDEAKKKVYEFRGGNFEFGYTEFNEIDGNQVSTEVILKGNVVNVDLHYNIDNLPNYVDENSPDITKTGYYVLTATLHNATFRDISYPSMNISMQGKILKDAPQISSEFVSFDIESAVIYITAAHTDYQKQVILQELYDYVKDSLNKLAFPSYEFSVESGNFVFAKEFEPFKDKLELGSTINLALDDDEDNIIQPILIEIQLNYDDESDFAIVFSNKYRSSRSEFKIADLITEMNRQTRSTTINKASYSAYKDSQAGSQVDNLTNNAIDVVRNKVINSNNQSIQWDSSGMFFRKTLPNGLFDPHQIGMINDNIAFTKDNWKSVEIAIGAFTDPNLGEGYGIIAPAIFGTLVAGENLVIENKVETESGDVVKQFKVDSTGAWLHNSLLAFTKEPDQNTGYSGGKILIDPEYGIAAGNISLFTLNGSEVIPTFWDKENNKIIWDESKVVETADGSVYYVPKNSQFYFDINTGNAYFAGTISGENIVANTINGKAIQNGTVDAGSKLAGDISPEQMKQYVLDAINQYATITESPNKISLNLIGGLTNLNFEGGTITADEVDAKHITGDLIEAINASIGTINADKVNISGAVSAGKLIINGEKAKLAIDPDYGIVAGNADVFTVDENNNIVPSFLNPDGSLIIDDYAPRNSSFYFDIKTGQAYYSGPLSASQITTGKLTSDYLEVKEGYITNAMIESLAAGKINAGSISANVMEANVIAAINSYIGEATINSAKIGDLEADKIKSGTIDCDLLTVVGLIDGNVANIKNINAGNIKTDTIDANFSNAIVGQIGAAAIKNAMIDSLSFDKITGFDVNTTKLTVHSDDGKSTWTDNTIQISDANRVRVQIGEDSAGDYSMYVWDAAGNLMFDALGVTESGIQREIIKDSMVAQDAAIQATKLDLKSLFKTVNDNIEQLDAGSLYFDGKTFDVLFAGITTDISNQGAQIASQGTQLTAIQGQIDSKIWQQDIDSATGAMNTKYSSLEQDLTGFKTTVADTYATKDGLNSVKTTLEQSLDGFKTTVAKEYATVESVNNQYSTLQQDLDGFKTTVESTYATKTGLENVKTTLEQNLNGFKTTVSKDYATKTEAQAAQDAADKAQSDVDALSTNVTTNYATKTEVTQTADEIKSSVSSTYATKTALSETDTKAANAGAAAANAQKTADGAVSANTALAERVTTAESSITQNANAITQTVQKIDNIKIGGRNLLLDTENMTVDSSSGNATRYYCLYGNYTGTGGGLAETDDGIKLTFGALNGVSLQMPLASFGSVDNGEIVTLSFDYRGNITNLGRFYFLQQTTPNVSVTSNFPALVDDGDWHHYEHTFSALQSNVRTCVSVLMFYSLASYDSTKWVEIKRGTLKLEKGNKATDWAPAPEDSVALINKNSADIDEILETKIPNIDSRFSTVEQTAQGIAGRVSTVEEYGSKITNLTTTLEKVTSVLIKDGSVQFDFNTIISELDGAKEDLKKINHYVHIDDSKYGAGIAIGETGEGASDFVALFTKDSLQFLNGSTVIAEYANDGLITENIYTNNQIAFRYGGNENWAIRPGAEISAGKWNLNDVWIGG